MPNTLKTMAEMTHVPQKKHVAADLPPMTEGEIRATKIFELEEKFKSARAALQASNAAFYEARGPACEAVDDCRRLAARIENTREYLTHARGHSQLFDERMTTLVGAGSAAPYDLSTVANSVAGDPVGATAGRLVNYLKTALADLELAFKSAVVNTRKLATEAPDSKPLLEDLEKIIATLD